MGEETWASGRGLVGWRDGGSTPKWEGGQSGGRKDGQDEGWMVGEAEKQTRGEDGKANGEEDKLLG